MEIDARKRAGNDEHEKESFLLPLKWDMFPFHITEREKKRFRR